MIDKAALKQAIIDYEQESDKLIPIAEEKNKWDLASQKQYEKAQQCWDKIRSILGLIEGEELSGAEVERLMEIL